MVQALWVVLRRVLCTRMERDRLSLAVGRRVGVNNLRGQRVFRTCKDRNRCIINNFNYSIIHSTSHSNKDP